MNRLLPFPLLMAGIAPAMAQTPEDSSPEADYELVTTAVHTRRSETALPITLMTGEELRDAASATLGDTLSAQPGINNASFGPAVGQTVIRGQQGRRVLSMSNAIPNADVSGNSADHAQAVEPLLADAVEVLRGPATLLYGGGAIGGVVNVIDNRIPRSLPSGPSAAFETRHATASDKNTVIGTLDLGAGNTAWHLDGLYREWNDLDIPGPAIAPAWLEAEHDPGHEEEAPENTEGYIPNTGGETSSFTGGVSRHFAEGRIGFSVSRLDNRYGLPPGAHESPPEEEEADLPGAAHGEEDHGDVSIDMGRTRYDLDAEWDNPAPLLENLRYRLSFTDYEHAEIEGNGEVGTRFTNDSWQHRLQLTHPETAGWHGVFGWQSAREAFGAMGEESFIPATDIRSNGIFLVEDFHAGDVTYELGARINRDTLSPDSTAPEREFTTHSYSGSALWQVSVPINLGLTWSHSERPPSVEELYSNFSGETLHACVIHFATGACEIGDPGFGEEASENADLSIYLDYAAFNATITVFYNGFEDYIFKAATGEETGGFPVREYRQTDARFTGLEADATFFLGDTLALRLFGDTIDGRLDGHGDAPRIPPVRLGSRLTYTGIRWSAFAGVLHVADQNEAGVNELPTPGYTRWEAGADYRFDLGTGGELTVYARGHNLTDEEIRLSTSYLRGYAPEAGRSLEVGLRYRF